LNDDDDDDEEEEEEKTAPRNIRKYRGKSDNASIEAEET
jgi:hypothetical protein